MGAHRTTRGCRTVKCHPPLDGWWKWDHLWTVRAPRCLICAPLRPPARPRIKRPESSAVCCNRVVRGGVELAYPHAVSTDHVVAVAEQGRRPVDLVFPNRHVLVEQLRRGYRTGD